MANDVIDRGANGSGKGWISWRLVVEWRWYGFLHVTHIGMANAIQLASADARLYKRCHVV